eukprot:CAMPEP_0114568864 /NCGR_PEP_ID=MMETSP0114-20121206/16292_1 /TAXON_ID=31324 /ORGANISM="Goniomonas sp, Strain m" /LENGTH=238 /DNA_ID=CAMNT_0001755649 /DNA_START=10 /DNA_END=722 /DNA_ORIENTATION=-
MCSAMFIGADEGHVGSFIVTGFASVVIAAPAPFLLDRMFQMVRRRRLRRHNLERNRRIAARLSLLHLEPPIERSRSGSHCSRSPLRTSIAASSAPPSARGPADTEWDAPSVGRQGFVTAVDDPEIGPPLSLVGKAVLQASLTAPAPARLVVDDSGRNSFDTQSVRTDGNSSQSSAPRSGQFAQVVFGAMCALKAGRHWQEVVRKRRMTSRQRTVHAMKTFFSNAVLFVFGNNFSADEG